ncbi:hypothetical protein BV25DRAFT_303652 [Artomyces pyxidatus]|uniref:Uncharacterized protein n=1 Tax=Artomyces pyxidatus TaxID=48021 RepID=A0ACB8T810_9AGAM|nr:hypothetical protein BV25DRAFT_303652 [Artomyces pyxidatus]
MQVVDLSRRRRGLLLWYNLARARFPALRELSVQQWCLLDANDNLEFLLAHPTIKHLVWRAPYRPLDRPRFTRSSGFLPALTHLTTDSWEIVRDFLGGPLPLSSVEHLEF